MESLLAQFDPSSLQSSLPVSLLIAFLGGLLASLTPCVYPMIPITAGIIGHANLGGSRRRGFLLSLIYVLGMAATYAALGIFAASTGRFFGAVNSSPWTFLLVGSIILLFALGMLDILRMPLLGAGNWPGRRMGLLGILLAGMSAALVAGPCTTPVLGTLLVYTATSKSILAGGLLLFVFSLGMGVLLLGIGTCSSLLASMPRSGAWMATVKKAMGLGMVVLAGYFYHKAWIFFS